MTVTDDLDALRRVIKRFGSPQVHRRVTPDLAITFTGMPTLAKLYVQRATVNDWRTHPCDAG